jgi:hypothetical protein
MNVNGLLWATEGDDFSSTDFWSSWLDYTKKVIYCGTQNNVLLPIYITTIIHIQNQNKVVEFLVAWLFTMPHV